MVCCLFAVPTLAQASPISVHVTTQGQDFKIDASFSAPVTRKDAFQVMTDYAQMASFVPQMLRSEVLWRSGDREAVLQEGNIHLWWLRFPTDDVLQVHLYPDRAVTFHSTGGNQQLCGWAQIVSTGKSRQPA